MSIGVVGGPSLSANNHFNAEAYEKIEATIPKNSVPTAIDVQPSELSELQAIMILADSYEDLTFTVDEEVTEFTFDGPLILLGPGNIGMLGATVYKLTFTNANALTDNNITILVVRTAVEPEA